MPVDTNDLKLEFIDPAMYPSSNGTSWNLKPPAVVTWTLPTGATQSQTTVIQNLTNLETDPYTVINTTGTNGIVYSPTYPIDDPRNLVRVKIGNHYQTGPAVTVTLEFLDVNNNVLTPPAGPNYTVSLTANYGGWVQGDLGTTQSNDPTQIRNAVPGAVKVRLRIDGIGAYAIKNVWIPRYWPGDTDVPETAVLQAQMTDNPTNRINFCTGIRIRRGCRKNPPLDQLEIGTMEFRLQKINWFDPGYMVRLRALSNGVWETVFQGTIREARKWRDPNAKLDTDDYTDFVVVDRVAELAVAPAPFIKSGNIRQRIKSVTDQSTATNKPTVTVTGPVTQAPTATPVNILQEDAKMLDQLLTIRNTDMGLLWVDRFNNIQYATSDERRVAPVSPVNAPVINFVDKNPAAGEKVVLASGFDRNDQNELFVSTLTFERIGIAASTGKPYKFTAGPLVRTSGPNAGRTGNVPVIEAGTPFTGNAVNIGNYYMGQWTGGKRAYDSFKWNVTQDVATIAKVDIYDKISLVMAREINDFNVYKSYYIMGIEHDIRPGKWLTRIELRPVGNQVSIDGATPGGVDGFYTGSINETPAGETIVIPT